MATTTIRVPEETHAKLQRLAAEEGHPIGKVIDELLDRYERDRFFEEMAEDFARLRADPVASADYDAELAAWDATLLDGLAEYPYEEPTTSGSEE
jgi:predicted transcriptional regulator